MFAVLSGSVVAVRLRVFLSALDEYLNVLEDRTVGKIVTPPLRFFFTRQAPPPGYVAFMRCFRDAGLLRAVRPVKGSRPFQNRGFPSSVCTSLNVDGEPSCTETPPKLLYVFSFRLRLVVFMNNFDVRLCLASLQLRSNSVLGLRNSSRRSVFFIPLSSFRGASPAEPLAEVIQPGFSAPRSPTTPCVCALPSESSPPLNLLFRSFMR